MNPIAAGFTGNDAGGEDSLSEDLRCGVHWLATGLVISSLLWGIVLAALWAVLFD